MTDPPNGKPSTFWGDRWRFARERTGRRLGPAFKNFSSRLLLLTLTLILGSLIFGATHIYAQWRAYVAGLFALLAVLAITLITGMAVFVFYLVTAPAAMWKRDQEMIAQLRASLTPALKLTFDEQCLRYVPRGKVTLSVIGHRFHDGEGSDRHVLIKCVNFSKAPVEGVQARMADLKAPPPDQDATQSTQFFHAVRLRAFDDHADTTALPPEGETFFCVLTQPTEFDPPRPNESQPHYHYEFLFTKPGTYEMRIEAHGQNTPVAKAVLVMELKREWLSDGMYHKHPRYEIVSVRQKDVH